MTYRTASFRINGHTRSYNAKTYGSSSVTRNIEVKLIKIAVISFVLALFFISSAILNQMYEKKTQENNKVKEYSATLLNQYKSLTEEKNNYISQKNYSEYTKKLGLHPPRENQIIRIKD
jgi:hypothetical protein